MSGITPFGTMGGDCRPSRSRVRLGHVGGLCGLAGRHLGLLEVSDGVLELRRQMSDALFGFGDHVLLHRCGVGGFDDGLVGVLGAGLSRGGGGGDGVQLVLGLLGGFLSGMGGVLRLLVEGHLALELLLGLVQLPLEVLDDGLSPYQGCLRGLSCLKI